MSNSNANSVVKRFVEVSLGETSRGTMTHLRVQKLLYFAEAWSLETRNTSLFTESIQAWPLGPVVPEVFFHFKHLEGNPFESDDVKSCGDLNEEDALLVNAVWEVYKSLSPAELVDISHGEKPWVSITDAGRNLKPYKAIPRDLIAEAYHDRERPVPILEFENHLLKRDAEAALRLRARKPIGIKAFAELAARFSPPQSWFTEKN